MTDDEWRALYESFETRWLLDAVDEVDTLRGHLSDDQHHRPPDIRNNLLKLHQLAIEVINNGSRSRVHEFFDLATDLEDQVLSMMEVLTKLQDTLTKLTDLRPESSSDDSDD